MSDQEQRTEAGCFFFTMVALLVVVMTACAGITYYLFERF